jgi:hypothetical protein
MKTSQQWVAHFKQNLQQQRVNWNLDPNITPQECKAIIRSLQAWQLGETSDGANLIKAATIYTNKINDTAYLDAVKLFIQEEQKHGKNLGKYLDAIGYPRLKKDWGDTLFRKVRYFNTNMELWTVTVIIVESFAQLFYHAVSNATKCDLLKQICGDILKDEAPHIKFQLERLCIINLNRNSLLTRIRLKLYELFAHVILITIWIAHARAFKAGGYTFETLAGNIQRRMRYISYHILNEQYQALNQQLTPITL